MSLKAVFEAIVGIIETLDDAIYQARVAAATLRNLEVAD